MNRIDRRLGTSENHATKVPAQIRRALECLRDRATTLLAGKAIYAALETTRRIRVLGAPMKIDVFPHILPKKYFDRLLAVAPPGLALQKRMSGIPVLVDLELRLTMMDRWDGYVQVLTLANPPIEVVARTAVSPDLARLANDEMAAIVARHPDRFPGFVASLPMNSPDAALVELER